MESSSVLISVVITVASVATATIMLIYLINLKKINKELKNKKEENEKKLNEAKKYSDELVKKALFEAKQIALNENRDFEKRQKEKNQELQKMESLLNKREIELDEKSKSLESKRTELKQRFELLEKEESQVQRNIAITKDKLDKSQKELELIANLSIEDAREKLTSLIKTDVERNIAKEIRAFEDDARKASEDKARSIIATSIQRLANEFVAESCVSVISLPSDDMKGRIIGREGRNIRAIEQATGVDLIIDDTPEAILISCFNPIRREIAAISLERLLADGRIHPSRIEEIVQKVTSEFDQIIQETGERSAFDMGFTDFHPEIITNLGKLKFLTTGGQSVLQHSLEVSEISGRIASEIGSNVKLAKRAGLLHDIGKSLNEDHDGNHAEVGAKFLKEKGESQEVIEAVLKHHSNYLHGTQIYTSIVQSANLLSNFRPGAKKEFLEKAISRLKEMEGIIEGFDEIENAYVIRSGREVRAFVSSRILDDKAVTILAKKVAKSLKKDVNSPGPIKVTMIREQRVTEVAK